jgi:hypothetical protein
VSKHVHGRGEETPLKVAEEEVLEDHAAWDVVGTSPAAAIEGLAMGQSFAQDPSGQGDYAA